MPKETEPVTIVLALSSTGIADERSKAPDAGDDSLSGDDEVGETAPAAGWTRVLGVSRMQDKRLEWLVKNRLVGSLEDTLIPPVDVSEAIAPKDYAVVFVAQFEAGLRLKL